MLPDHFKDRFRIGETEKNYMLIRYDMIVGLKKLYDVIREIAMELIEAEEDAKYRKKYTSVWKQKKPCV